MTPNEFKKYYPEYAHLEDEQLWNCMEEILVRRGISWTADYSEGYVVVGTVDYRTEDDGVTPLELRDPKYWINDITGERITNEERLLMEKKRSNPDGGYPIESYKFDILDFTNWHVD